MSFEQKKLDRNTYFIDMTYRLPFLSKVFYIREQEVPDDILFAKFSFLKGKESLPDAILYAKIPYYKFMRKINVYSDENRENKCFSIIQNSFAFPHRYVITDEQGASIGTIESKSLLFKRSWNIINEQGIVIGCLKENVRDNIVEEFRFSIQKSFSFGFIIQDKLVGGIEVETDYYSLSRKFILDLTNDKERKLDRRLALALVLIMDDFVNTSNRGTPGI